MAGRLYLNIHHGRLSLHECIGSPSVQCGATVMQADRSQLASQWEPARLGSKNADVPGGKPWCLRYFAWDILGLVSSGSSMRGNVLFHTNWLKLMCIWELLSNLAVIDNRSNEPTWKLVAEKCNPLQGIVGVYPTTALPKTAQVRRIMMEVE